MEMLIAQVNERAIRSAYCSTGIQCGGLWLHHSGQPTAAGAQGGQIAPLRLTGHWGNADEEEVEARRG